MRKSARPEQETSSSQPHRQATPVSLIRVRFLPAGAFHPSAKGQAAIAAAVLATLQTS